MRPPIPPDIQQLVASLRLPDRFSVALTSYTEELIRRLAPECVILFGSLAKGTYTSASDIDLVVVASHLTEGFLDRLSVLQGLNGTACPIDAFGYTPEEFQHMLRGGHVTALDALADGIPLCGEDHFGQSRGIFQDMLQRGLRRSACSWVLPVPIQPCEGP